jgi:hypothetical protein
MIEIEKIKVDQDFPKSISCDVCGNKYHYADDADDIMEIQEFFSFYQRGGYRSIICDDVDFEIDICQHCFVKVFGQYLKYPGNPEFEKEQQERFRSFNAKEGL